MMSGQATAPAPDGDRADAIRQLFALRAAVDQQILRLVAEHDAEQAYRADGVGSMAEWLVLWVNIAMRSAHQLVRTARKLARLPAIAQALGEGRLSEDQVRILVGYATPQDDAELAEAAVGVSVAQLQRDGQSARRREPDDAAAPLRRRALRVWWDTPEGMLQLFGSLPPLEGALVKRALEYLADQMPRDPQTGLYEPYPARLADALVELVARADLGELAGADPDATLAEVGAPGADVGAPGGDHDACCGAEPASGAGDPSRAGELPTDGGSRERQRRRRRARSRRIAVHGTIEQLVGSAETLPWLRDGPAIPPETAQRMLCEAITRIVFHDEKRRIVAMSSRTRVPTEAMVDALWVRDQGCVFPWCRRTTCLEVHHVIPVELGGPTEMWNVALVCWPHHRLVHEGGWAVSGDANVGLVFRDPSGCVHEVTRLGLDPDVRERILGVEGHGVEVSRPEPLGPSDAADLEISRAGCVDSAGGAGPPPREISDPPDPIDTS